MRNIDRYKDTMLMIQSRKTKGLTLSLGGNIVQVGKGLGKKEAGGEIGNTSFLLYVTKVKWARTVLDRTVGGLFSCLFLFGLIYLSLYFFFLVLIKAQICFFFFLKKKTYITQMELILNVYVHYLG